MSERLEHVVDWELGDGNISAHHLGTTHRRFSFMYTRSGIDTVGI